MSKWPLKVTQGYRYLVQENKNDGLPAGRNCLMTHSLFLTEFTSVSGRQTHGHGQTDRTVVAHTALA